LWFAEKLDLVEVPVVRPLVVVLVVGLLVGVLGGFQAGRLRMLLTASLLWCSLLKT
jgi:hypothetical protein